MVFGFRMVRTIPNPNFQNGRFSLDRFIYIIFICLYIKRPRLAIVRFSNGKKFGFRMGWAIRKPNFETFRFRMDSDFEWLEFEPPLYLSLLIK